MNDTACRTIDPEPQGGGHSGTEWLPTAKRPRRVEAVNAKFRGGKLFKGKKRGAVNFNLRTK